LHIKIAAYNHMLVWDCKDRRDFSFIKVFHKRIIIRCLFPCCPTASRWIRKQHHKWSFM